MARIMTLLSHFYVSPMTPGEAEAIATDWAKALGAFPQWAVSEACDEYLRTQKRKPTIAAIVELCEGQFWVVDFTRRKAMRGPQSRRRHEEREPISEDARESMRKRLSDLHKDLSEKVDASNLTRLDVARSIWAGLPDDKWMNCAELYEHAKTPPGWNRRVTILSLVKFGLVESEVISGGQKIYRKKEVAA